MASRPSRPSRAGERPTGRWPNPRSEVPASPDLPGGCVPGAVAAVGEASLPQPPLRSARGSAVRATRSVADLAMARACPIARHEPHPRLQTPSSDQGKGRRPDALGRSTSPVPLSGPSCSSTPGLGWILPTSRGFGSLLRYVAGLAHRSPEELARAPSLPSEAAPRLERCPSGCGKGVDEGGKPV